MLPLLLSSLSVLSGPAQAPAASAPGLMQRVAVLGASVSAGYGLRNELEVDATLADVLQAACPDATFRSHGDAMFFTAPTRIGRELADAALAEKPTLVVAVDFLFWYALDYDRLRSGVEGRLEGIEQGLALLDRFGCPILLGDIPDVSVSLQGHGPFGVPMIPAYAIPDDATRARLNERIRAWAAERERVRVFSLEAFLERVVEDQAFEVHGNRVPAGARDELLQEDLLHPSLRGNLFLCAGLLDEIGRWHPEVDLGSVRWAVEDAREALFESTRAARERARERARARAERLRRHRHRSRQGAGSGQGTGSDG